MPSFLINASAARSTETSARLSTPQRGQSTGNLTMGFFMVMPRKLLPFFPEKQKGYYGLIGLLSTNAIYLGQIYHIPVIPLATRATRNIRRCDICGTG